MQAKRLNKPRTVVTEVLFFLDNSVHLSQSRKY